MQTMKLNTVRNSFLFSLAAACLLPGAAGAQAAPGIPGSSNPVAPSTPAASQPADSMKPAGVFVRTDSLRLQKEDRSRVVQYPFAGDPRLDVKVTLHEKDATVTDALKALSKATHVEMTAVGSSLPTTHFCVFAADTPLRNVLDGMAHLHGWEWKALKDKSLELCTRPRANQWAGLRPNTEAQAEQYAQGRQFLSQFATCPPALQSALTDMHHNGIPFSSLPPEMQQTVQNMLTAAAPGQTVNFPGNIHIPTPAAENSTIRLQGGGGDQEWGSEYYVSVFDGHTGVLLDFPKFNDPNEDTDEVVPASALQSVRWYGASEDAASRQTTAKEDTRLHVPVTAGP